MLSPIRCKAYAAVLVVCGGVVLAHGCSMTEEVKRIQEVRQAQKRRDAASLEDLTGQQIFLRSCNPCHTGFQSGIGPTLEKLTQHFATSEALKRFIRSGKGAMPAQPKTVLNDRELDNLVEYLQSLPKG